MVKVKQKPIETVPTTPSPKVLTNDQKQVLAVALQSFKNNEPNWDNLKPIKLDKGQEQLPECQTLIRTVYETILGEITKKPEHVETGIKWLISVDPEHASFYNGILARFLFAQNKLEECVQVLKGQITSIKEKDAVSIKTYSDNKDYSKLIDIYQKYLPEESCVNPDEQRRYEKNMLGIVNLILPSQKDEKIENLEKKTQISLTKQQIHELENFLAYSLGNVELNRRLHLKANKTPAENFIYSLSHITSAEVSGTAGIKTLLQSVQTITDKLDQKNAKLLWGAYSEIDANEVDLLKELPETDKKAFAEILARTGKNIWEIRKSSEYINFLTNLDPKAKNIKIQHVLDNIATVKEHEDNLNLQGEKLDYKTLKQLEMFDSIQPNLEKIGSQCDNFRSNPILHEIYEGCTAAQVTLNRLKTMMKSSSSYQAGDVLIRDEKLYKKFSGGKRTVYSEVSLWMNIKGAWQMAKDAIGKGVWSVQPYFTGSRMHARVVYNNSEDIVDPDNTDNVLAKVKTPVAADITIQGYDEAEITPGSTMEEVALRPDFKKILSDKGRALLKDKKPSPEEYVRRIFAEKLSNDIETKQTTNKELTLDEMRGFRAFALSKVHSKIKWIINVLFGENGIVRPLVNIVVGSARGKKEAEDLVTKEENKRICSEFVSETLRNALEETQAQLRNDLNDQTLTFFNDVFPSKIDLPSEEIHPDYLEQLLIKQGYFTEIKRPPILQQIFKGVEEDIGTTKSA